MPYKLVLARNNDRGLSMGRVLGHNNLELGDDKRGYKSNDSLARWLCMVEPKHERNQRRPSRLWPI